MNEVHRTEVHQHIDGDYISFWPTCSCGWRDRVSHPSRQAAEDSADDHVLAVI